MARSQFGSVESMGGGVWRVSWEVARGADGKRHRKSKNVRGSRHQAELVLARAALEAGRDETFLDRLLLRDFWELEYSPSIQRLAPMTVKSYTACWERWVEPLFGDDDMASAKARMIERRLQAIPNPGSQRNAFKLLRQMYNLAYEWEMIEDNPMARRIRLDRMPSYEPDVLTIAELPAVLDAVRDRPVEPVIICALFAGLRREEACALMWEDFSFEDEATVSGSRVAAYISVQRTAQLIDGSVVVGRTKTAKSTRTVVIVGPVAQRLRELSGSGWLNPSKKEEGACGNPETVASGWRTACRNAGIRCVPMKNLRTTYATIQQQLGTDSSVISAMLGHSQLNTAYKHYLASNVDTYRAAASKIARFAE